MSLITTELRSLHTRLLEHKTQLSLSIRATVAAVLSLVLSNLLHLPLPLWTVLTAVILTQVSFGRSVKATLDYLAGTVAGAVYAGAVAAFVPHANEIALIGVLVIVVAPLALVGAIKPSFSVSTFTGVLVILVPAITHVTPIESAFYRVVEVAIGGVIALAVSVVILPTHAHSLAIEAAARTINLTARCLPELFAGFVQAKDATALERIHENIGGAITQLNAITEEAEHERIGLFHAEPDLGPLMRTLLRLRYDLIVIARAASVPLPQKLQERLGPPLTHVAATAANYLRRSGEALGAGHAPSSIGDFEAALDSCAEDLATIRREGTMGGLDVDAMEVVFTLELALEQMRRNFHDLERAVRAAARDK
jgi:uncharacterized membrane protein YccC